LRHRLTRILPYAPGQLFALVGDVERYPQFIKWVTELRTFNRREAEEGVYLLDAEAAVRFSFVREHFTTRVRLDARNLAIDVDLIAGPFRRLTNRWRFAPHPDGAALSFEIDFEFKSRLLDALLHANQDRAMRRLIACFEDRAKALYG
jgi:coenzyme Q-binding protein COQ10